eukprot:m.61322 g.61322  ORF g.61322 m.61322 type:complete len:247 (-) comp13869_c2_seq8:631-1371(-)
MMSCSSLTLAITLALSVTAILLLFERRVVRAARTSPQVKVQSKLKREPSTTQFQIAHKSTAAALSRVLRPSSTPAPFGGNEQRTSSRQVDSRRRRETPSQVDRSQVDRRSVNRRQAQKDSAVNRLLQAQLAEPVECNMLLGIGVQKGGTTTLSVYLNKFSFVSPNQGKKEMHYFDKMKAKSSLADYLTRFSSTGGPVKVELHIQPIWLHTQPVIQLHPASCIPNPFITSLHPNVYFISKRCCLPCS